MARHHPELVARQLAAEIRQLVFGWTGRPPFAADSKRKAQIEDAADSVCRNIAEAVAASHAHFAGYLGIALRSLNDVMDRTRSAQLKGHVSADDVAAMHSLGRRLYPALTSLAAYLRKTPDPRRNGLAARTRSRT